MRRSQVVISLSPRVLYATLYATLFANIAIFSACTTAAPSRAALVADSASVDATRLPTGVHLDPAGVVHAVGPMPLNIAVAPGGARVALALNGWSRTGLQVVDWRSGRVTLTVDLPAAFLGLAFSPDGKWLAVSGGNTDQIYRFRWAGDSAVLNDSIALSPAAASRRNGTRYPAQIAFSPAGDRLYVAENLADSLAVVDMSSGKIVERRFAGRYPYGVVVAPDGRVFVSAWGGSVVASYNSEDGWLSEPEWIAAGRHPSAMLLNRDGSKLFVASASTDRIAVIDTKSGQRVSELRDPPPSGPDEGSTPNALALSSDETRLYVAEADANAVAVFDLTHGNALLGRIPTGWYPAAVALTQSSLLVANGKGSGTHANPDGPGPRESKEHQGSGKNGTLGQLGGTLSVLDATKLDSVQLAKYSARVAAANGWTAGRRVDRFPPFEHVIYVIRENRTYDQVLGDLRSADGDTSLVYFGRNVTPNGHAIAERFGT